MKNDKNKTKYIVVGTIIFVILCCTLIPYIINIFLDKNIISSVKTDSGDWLGFWGNVIGSLIGSMVGGVITIGGVLLTLKANNREDKKKGPLLFLPDKALMMNLYIDSEKVEISRECDDNYPLSYNMFKVFNIGKEHAININIKWEEPEDRVLYDYLKSNNVDCESVRKYVKINHELDYDNCKKTNFLKSNSEQEPYRFNIPMNLRDLIKGWIKYIGYKEEYFNDIPLGSIIISCENLTRDNFDVTYEMKGIYTKLECNNELISCGFVVEFSLAKYCMNEENNLFKIENVY